MPKYFCEYCGIYLTHSSPGGRKQHSHGRKHINNKIEYYSQFLYEFQQNAYNNLLSMATRISANPQMPNIVPNQPNQMGQMVSMMNPIMSQMPPMGAMPLPTQVPHGHLGQGFDQMNKY